MPLHITLIHIRLGWFEYRSVSSDMQELPGHRRVTAKRCSFSLNEPLCRPRMVLRVLIIGHITSRFMLHQPSDMRQRMLQLYRRQRCKHVPCLLCGTDDMQRWNMQHCIWQHSLSFERCLFFKPRAYCGRPLQT